MREPREGNDLQPLLARGRGRLAVVGEHAHVDHERREVHERDPAALREQAVGAAEERYWNHRAAA